MGDSIASSEQSESRSFQSDYSNSSRRQNRRHNRKQNSRTMQTTVQNVNYDHRLYSQAQQQTEWNASPSFYNEYYYGRPSSSREEYNTPAYSHHSHHHHHQPRRVQKRYEHSYYHSTRQGNIRQNTSSSVRSANEVENLRSNLIEQLLKNTYECMICINKINRDQETWSCDICYKIFHLDCVKQWASSDESGSDKNWRCPGCQYSYSAHPIYSCFCHKRINPVFQPGEIPHSCGEQCNKLLNEKSNDCNHHCSELCHPGPCPTCTSMIKRSCLCGRESRMVMCSSKSIIKCENICGKLKSCQHHKCETICHPRECEECDHLIKQTCYSHGQERQVRCSFETGSTNVFNCGDPCGKLLACGHHQCKKTCHSGPCPECTLSPENCDTCACGTTKMSNTKRTSCLDPLPTCERPCGKTLLCGSVDDHHKCTAKCHNGSCPPCDKQTVLKCRCGQLAKPISCNEAVKYDPIKNPFCCDRRCNKKKICGKHRCNELCCDRDIHVCEIVCGKTLSCGIHQCEELCHKNSCRKCPVNIYEELACQCGQTVLQPPIPCGTKPPGCNYKCNRTHTCDHPVYHSCHNESECPPCAHLVSKQCVGGHSTRNNVPCYIKEVFCGQPCGQPLACGIHTCQRSCHAGPCHPNDQQCTQRCPIKRRDCGHPCNLICHGREPCPLTVCREVTKVRCPCGRLVKDVVCNVKPNEFHDEKDEIDLTQSLVQALSVRTIDLSLARKQQQQQQTQPQIECDDECRIIQRNKSLAQALSINLDEPRQTSIIYTDFLRDFARQRLDFVQNVERQLAQLVEETQRHRVSKRCYSFKPMKRTERQLVHELAEFYGLETYSVDPEPNRNVVAYASFGMCKTPPMALSEMIRREKVKVPPPVPLT